MTAIISNLEDLLVDNLIHVRLTSGSVISPQSGGYETNHCRHEFERGKTHQNRIE